MHVKGRQKVLKQTCVFKSKQTILEDYTTKWLARDYRNMIQSNTARKGLYEIRWRSDFPLGLENSHLGLLYHFGALLQTICKVISLSAMLL